jgi:DNA-binding LacI/PurR family transcriptional regulator
VATDNLNGAVKGVKELLKLNGKMKKIVYIGESKRNLPLEERLKGVKKEAYANGIRMLSKDIFLIEPEKKKMILLGNKIFSKKLKDFGIFLESNRFLPGLLAAAAKHGASIPDDACVTGFDPVELKIDSPEDLEEARVLKKPLRVILQDTEKLSKSVVDYLLLALGDKGSGKRKIQLKLPVSIFKA